MKLSHKLYIFTICLMTMAACTIPGSEGQSNSVIPTIGMGQLETAISGTSSAAIALTSQASSPTPYPTVAPTVTPAFKSLEASESALIKQPGGATYFIDARAGYSIMAPPGWVAIRINQPEYYDAILLPEMANPNFQTFLNTFNNKDPNIFRLAAVDTRNEHIVSAQATHIVFEWLQDKNLSLASESDLKEMSGKYAASEGFVPRATSISILMLPSELKIGMIEWEIMQTNAAGAVTFVYQKQAVFPKKTGGLTTIWFSTEFSLKDSILPEFDAMLATIAMQ